MFWTRTSLYDQSVRPILQLTSITLDICVHAIKVAAVHESPLSDAHP
jgi:hypothetical protein